MPGREVLLIEDDQEIRESMEEALILEGYQVIAAENGAAGLRALEEKNEISLVLLDLMMPVMNGYEFIGQLRSRGDLSRIPLIVVSANADRRRIEGVAGVLRKPFDLESLFESIRKAAPEGQIA